MSQLRDVEAPPRKFGADLNLRVAPADASHDIRRSLASGSSRQVAAIQLQSTKESPLSINPVFRTVAFITCLLGVGSLSIAGLTLPMVRAQSTSGTISGPVFDGSGRPLPGIKVTVVNEQNGNARATVTA